jgi:hypothetical protein
VIDPMPTATTEPSITNGRMISPAEVRPRLAQMTAESVGEIQQAPDGKSRACLARARAKDIDQDAPRARTRARAHEARWRLPR